MERNWIRFSATGDSFITRRIPKESSSYQKLSALFNQTDVRFTNLEVTTHNQEGEPGAVSGGTWAMASPDVLEDLKGYGFNLVAWANNHSLDYSIGGLLATEKYLNQYGFVHAGVGKNLASASEPRYLDTVGGRVALISATSSFHETWAAGEQRPDMMGRPGVNPLRYKTVYKVSKEDMEHLQRISERVGINDVLELSIKEGFKVKPTDGTFTFGGHSFKVASSEGKETTPEERDMKRILRSITEAKRQSDYVVVSIHSHEMKGKEKDKPADFLVEFSRACIDAGAHAVIGHGPHIVRGIEIYKNRPIFYSLGNFIFQNETVTHLPADFYERYGLSLSENVADALDLRTGNNTKGFGINPDIWSSIVPVWKMEGDRVKEIELHPIDLGYGQPRYRRGWPTLTKDITVLEKLQELSMPFGTRIEIVDGIGKIVVEDETNTAKDKQMEMLR